MLEPDLRELVSSKKYLEDSNITERRKAVKRKWTQVSTNRNTSRRVRSSKGGLTFRTA